MLSPEPSGILVVDDTPENLRLVTGMLVGRGFEVRPVTSGAEALDAAAYAPPELILLDVSMPGMDGFEVCTKLKQNPSLASIPVIFLTALSDSSDKVKGFAVGGADYVTKPFQMEEVIARVSHHLALSRSRRELQVSYDKLTQLEKLRDDLVHMIVHDMRSPLTALILNLSFVANEIQGEPQQVANDCVGVAEQLADMANALLDVSRLETGNMPLSLAECDLLAVARTAAQRVGGRSKERTIAIDPGSALVRCDEGLVRRVLENLLGNAIKHSPAGGSVHVSANDTALGTRVVVADDGPGVPEAVRPRIFEKFSAAGHRTEGGHHSAGLGLAFCKLAIEAHGGTIGVEPASPQGSLFWFVLPR